MLSPAALLFVYGFNRANGTMFDRFVEGSFTGIVLGLAVGPIVVVLATAIARGGLLGEKPDTGDEFMPHELLPGLLLVAILWTPAPVCRGC